MTDAPIDRAFFRENFPSSKLYGKKLTASRMRGFDAMFDAWDAIPFLDHLPWLAYALATAWHETQNTMLPVREGLKATDAEAYEYVTEYCRKNNMDNYAARHANGHSYYGRGYTQLTHGYNYEKMGRRLGLAKSLYGNPDRVMQEGLAGNIILTGMIEGLFRPAFGTLNDYFYGPKADWFNARDLIVGDKNKIPKWTNGVSLGELIGGYGRAFMQALR